MQTVTWQGQMCATSSIAHAGETRGTITLLRREMMCTPEGRTVLVPVISGNTWRGRLRRIAEELLRDVVAYEGLLHPAAAHALRGGGSLAKSSHEPLSGNRLQRLRDLVPLIGVFGAAGGGTIISGALDVGKVVPVLSETERITGVSSSLSAFSATQLEALTRQDDARSHDFVDVINATPSEVSLKFDQEGRPEPSALNNQMLFHIETFPAGTIFSTWLRLRRPTQVELAFFLDVLNAFRREGRLGGRVGIGHGQVELNLYTDVDLHGLEKCDWREHMRNKRGEVIDALGWLV